LARALDQKNGVHRLESKKSLHYCHNPIGSDRLGHCDDGFDALVEGATYARKQQPVILRLGHLRLCRHQVILNSGAFRRQLADMC